MFYPHLIVASMRFRESQKHNEETPKCDECVNCEYCTHYGKVNCLEFDKGEEE